VHWLHVACKLPAGQACALAGWQETVWTCQAQPPECVSSRAWPFCTGVSHTCHQT
jgi:hypothetical protein